MKYYNVKQFTKKINKSRSTVYRFYNKNQELNLETKKKKNKRLFPIEHIKYFNSEKLFDSNKELEKKNKSMKNLINCLLGEDCIEKTLSTKNWSYFCTVAYKFERNEKSCYKAMTSMYDMLEVKYGAKTDIRLFFTTEEFANREGCHSHFVLYIKNENLHNEIIEDLKNFFNYDRFDFNVYDKYKAGVYYLAKKGLVGENWDFLSNNIKRKKENLLSK